MKLLEPLYGKGYHVYMDNFYTRPILFKDLLVKKFAASGTCRVARKEFPKALVPISTLPRGTSCFQCYSNLTAAHWQDKRDIYVLSTIIGDNTTKVSWRSGSEVLSVECSEIIEDYNNFMGGVDVSDQYMCYYSVGRKTMKWWRHVFWRLHDIAILNAFIIYCANHATSLQKIQSNKKF